MGRREATGWLRAQQRPLGLCGEKGVLGVGQQAWAGGLGRKRQKEAFVLPLVTVGAQAQVTRP